MFILDEDTLESWKNTSFCLY